MRNMTTLPDLIKAQGMGLREVAREAGVGRTSVWRWTRGLAHPLHAQAAALAEALDVPVERVLAAIEQSRRKARRAARKKELNPT